MCVGGGEFRVVWDAQSKSEIQTSRSFASVAAKKESKGEDRCDGKRRLLLLLLLAHGRVWRLREKESQHWLQPSMPRALLSLVLCLARKQQTMWGERKGEGDVYSFLSPPFLSPTLKKFQKLRGLEASSYQLWAMREKERETVWASVRRRKRVRESERVQ